MGKAGDVRNDRSGSDSDSEIKSTKTPNLISVSRKLTICVMNSNTKVTVVNCWKLITIYDVLLIMQQQIAAPHSVSEL